MSRGLRPPKLLPAGGPAFGAPNVDEDPKGEGVGAGAPNPEGAGPGLELPIAPAVLFGEGDPNVGMLGPPKVEADPPNGAAAPAPKAGVEGVLLGPPAGAENGEGEGPAALNGEGPSGGF